MPSALLKPMSWRAAYRGLVPDERLNRLDPVRGADRFRESIARESEFIYVAEDAAGIVGFFAFGPCRDLEPHCTAAGEVYALYLVPQYWRQGIGSMMSRAADRLLASGGYSRVVLWVFEANARARLFYETMGFVADGARAIRDVGAPVNCMRYGKAL